MSENINSKLSTYQKLLKKTKFSLAVTEDKYSKVIVASQNNNSIPVIISALKKSNHISIIVNHKTTNEAGFYEYIKQQTVQHNNSPPSPQILPPKSSPKPSLKMANHTSPKTSSKSSPKNSSKTSPKTTVKTSRVRKPLQNALNFAKQNYKTSKAKKLTKLKEALIFSRSHKAV